MRDRVPEKPSGLVVGWGALNVDLIFEVDDFKSLGPGPVRPEPGKELCGSEEAFQWLLERLHCVGHLRWRNGGGSAANTLFALARMGFPTAYIGKVGDDPEGDLLIEGMRPVQTHWIRKGGRSGACLIVMDRRRDRFILVRENVANDTLALEEIDLEGLLSISWLHLTSFVGEVPLEAQIRILPSLSSATRVSMDPGEVYVRKGWERLRPLIQRCYVVFLTEEEVRLLTGESPTRGAKRILEEGPSVVVCKKGRRGSHIFTNRDEFEVSGEEVDVADNTGAGDVYNAGFLAGLFMRRSLEESARFATHISAISLTGYGRERYPTKRDLETFFNL